jgi:hypothetical protein
MIAGGLGYSWAGAVHSELFSVWNTFKAHIWWVIPNVIQHSKDRAERYSTVQTLTSHHHEFFFYYWTYITLILIYFFFFFVKYILLQGDTVACTSKPLYFTIPCYFLNCATKFSLCCICFSCSLFALICLSRHCSNADFLLRPVCVFEWFRLYFVWEDVCYRLTLYSWNIQLGLYSVLKWRKYETAWQLVLSMAGCVSVK